MISWPYLRSLTGLERQLGVDLDQARHVADGRVGIKAQQQIGRGQVEKVHRVRLDDLAHVQQLAQAVSPGAAAATPATSSQALADARWWLTGQMPQMRGVIDRHFEIHAALGELFKAAELVDVQIGSARPCLLSSR